MTNYHSFHMVNMSPWPLINSLNLMNFVMSILNFVKIYNFTQLIMLFLNFLILISTMLMWWRDMMRESSLQGFHTTNVTFGLKMGMILFIVSEIMFFLSFFWSFFHFSLSPEMEISNYWPPLGIMMFNPYQIPLLNSIILLSSGVTVTWAHHSIINNNFINSSNSLILTISLGLIFTIFQTIEYNESLFCINDSTFGTTFFMATGFHGLHVLIGTIFLMINLMRMKLSHLNNKHHFSFEAAAWYWHFVDVVWIYLYTFLYWWAW